MDPTVIHAIVSALPAPAITAACIMLAAALAPGHGRFVRMVQRVAPGLAVAVGMLVGYAAKGTGGWPLPPARFEHWVAIVSGLAALAAMAAARPGGSAWRWSVRGLLSAAVAVGVSWRLMKGPWSFVESACWIGGTTLAILLAWSSFDQIASWRSRVHAAGGQSRVMPAWCGPAMLAAWAGMASQALAATDSLLIGTYGAMVAACSAALVVGVLIRRSMDVAGSGPATQGEVGGWPSAGGTVAMLTGTLVFGGYHYSGLSLWMAVLLMAAPIVAAVADRVLFARINGVPRAALRLAVLAVLPGVVLAVAIPAAIRASESLGY